MPTDTAETRLTLDAHLAGPVIEGTLIDPTGNHHDFHGWLALAAVIEAALLRAEAPNTQAAGDPHSRKPITARARGRSA